jgi:hypothetical protein
MPLEKPRPPRPHDGKLDKGDDRGTQQGGQFRCPRCQSTFPPLLKKKVSPTGWVVFAAVLALGFGMCVVGICWA